MGSAEQLVAGDYPIPGEVERALKVGAIMTVSGNYNQKYEIQQKINLKS